MRILPEEFAIPTSRRRDGDLASLTARLEDENGQKERLNRQIKDLMHRIAELEEELEAERSQRSKVSLLIIFKTPKSLQIANDTFA